MDLVKIIAVLVAAWGIAGCGANAISPLARSSVAGLALTDSTTQQHFTLGIVNGALTLAEAADSTTASSGPQLIDASTGGQYALAVTAGALRLAAETNTGSGTSKILLVDTATTKSYALVVVNGALTLIPG
jgi:hypothetical protein